MRRRRLTFILVVQSILFLSHGFVYETWTFLWHSSDPRGASRLGIAFALLSVSFVGASLLAFRYYNVAVRTLYAMAATWLGILNFFCLASLACWIVYAGLRLAGIHSETRAITAVSFGVAILAALCGTANSFWLRVKRLEVHLANLPDSWRGRVAAVVSDAHLGPIRSVGFARRIVRLLNGLEPDVVFLTGDFYDGTAADIKSLALPLAGLCAPLGAFFVTGNHEEFGDAQRYVEALSGAGVRVLKNEIATIDRMQIVGVPHRETASSGRFLKALEHARLQPNQASILLVHAPNRLREAAQAGVSLQISGHTHKGQLFPWTLAVSRVFGRFAYGLNRLGDMQVYTTCGAGTWGPPVRLGSNPEIVLLRFA